MSGPSVSLELPHGVERRPLVLHEDCRGTFSEIFRAHWYEEISPVQWSVSLSEPGVVRGMHVHLRHDDYVVLVMGHASVGLYDMRPRSPTEGRLTLLDWHAASPAALIIPHGVAHGFYFHERSMYVLGVSEYWDKGDDLGFHWADPAVGIPWPVSSARLSDCDDRLPPLSEIAGRIPPWRD